MERILRARAAVTDIAMSAIGGAGPPSNLNALGAERGPAALINPVLETFLSTIGGDAAGFWEHVRHGWSSPLFVTPPEVWQRLPHGKTLTSDAAKIHPGIQHCLESLPSAPFTVTDLLSEHDWRNSDIGRSMRAQWGRNFQLMVPIDADTPGPTWWVWVIGREHLDFSSADRQVASAIQPVLTAVTRQFATVQRAHLPAQIENPLTRREHSVFVLLLDGHHATEIAARLSVSTRTVHKHVERVYRKFGVHDRPALLAAARARRPQASAEMPD